MIETVVKGGTVLDETGTQRADIGIGPDGNISAIGSDLSGENVIDASGCVVTSGLVDLNSHFCQPGNEEAETLESGTRSAVLGGYTAVMLMPDTTPAIDCAATVREIQSLRNEALCHVEIAGSLTIGCSGEVLAPIGELASLGVAFFTDKMPQTFSTQLIRRAMEYGSKFDITIGVTPFLKGEGHMHEGVVSSDLGIQGSSIEEEEVLTYQFVKLAQLTGTRLHLQQVSSPQAVEIVASSKTLGVPITCEVSPHHFSLTDEKVRGYESIYKVAPPLRPKDEVEKLKELITDGHVDAIATCHTPHPQQLVDLPFEEAPYGGIGLETALGVALTELDAPLQQILSIMSWAPAKIAGISESHGGLISEGRPGNLIAIDESVQWNAHGAEMASKSTNSPFEGHPLQGKVRHTVVNGEVVVLDGEAQR